jgi:hypothetical protein
MRMWLSTYRLLLILLFLPACTTSPFGESPLKQSPSYRLPFELEGGHLYLNVSLNGTSPRWFAVDSGSKHTIVSQVQAAALGLQSQGNIQVKGVGEQLIPATVMSGVTLTLAGASWDSSDVIAMPASFFSSFQQYLGRDFSGIIGSDFFDRFVVEVDYADQTIRLYEPKTYQYQGTGYQIPLKFLKEKPYVNGKIQFASRPPFKGLLLVDLGSGAALDLNEPLTTEVYQGLSQQRSLPRVTLGVGGEQTIRVARMQSLEMGDLKIDAPVTAFTLEQPPRQQKMSGRIGGQILSQFRVILNYKRKRLILEPQAPEKTHYDMSGLWLKTKGAPFEHILVDQVYEPSPAAAAGMQVGDRILSIDAQSNLPLSQVRDRLRRPGLRRLLIQRGDQKIPIQLTLKPLI